MSAEHHLAVPLYDSRSVKSCNALFAGEPAAQSILIPHGWAAAHSRAASTDLAFIHMHGDAMSPTLLDDDLLLLERMRDVTADGLYVFFLDGFMHVQRLARMLLSGEDESRQAGRPDRIVFFEPKDPNNKPWPMHDFSAWPDSSGIVGRIVWGAGRKL